MFGKSLRLLTLIFGLCLAAPGQVPGLSVQGSGNNGTVVMNSLSSYSVAPGAPITVNYSNVQFSRNLQITNNPPEYQTTGGGATYFGRPPGTNVEFTFNAPTTTGMWCANFRAGANHYSGYWFEVTNTPAGPSLDVQVSNLSAIGDPLAGLWELDFTATGTSFPPVGTASEIRITRAGDPSYQSQIFGVVDSLSMFPQAASIGSLPAGDDYTFTFLVNVENVDEILDTSTLNVPTPPTPGTVSAPCSGVAPYPPCTNNLSSATSGSLISWTGPNGSTGLPVTISSLETGGPEYQVFGVTSSAIWSPGNTATSASQYCMRFYNEAGTYSTMLSRDVAATNTTYNNHTVGFGSVFNVGDSNIAPGVYRFELFVLCGDGTEAISIATSNALTITDWVDPNAGGGGGGNTGGTGGGTGTSNEGAWTVPDVAAILSINTANGAELSAIKGEISGLRSDLQPGVTANTSDLDFFEVSTADSDALTGYAVVPSFTEVASQPFAVPFKLPGGGTYTLNLAIDPRTWNTSEPVYGYLDVLRGSLRALLVVFLSMTFVNSVLTALRRS